MAQLGQAAGFTPGSRTALNYLNQLLAQKGVDVGAANAVFGQEGASGGIGDSGHAFGPGQFNDAGGVWTGRFPGMSPEQKNQQAWSPQGLAELAGRVGSVASGLHGPAAVSNIVSRFERPANIPGEISRALASLGGGGGGQSFAPANATAMQQPTLSRAAAAPQGPAPTALANAGRLRALAMQLLRS